MLDRRGIPIRVAVLAVILLTSIASLPVSAAEPPLTAAEMSAAKSKRSEFGFSSDPGLIFSILERRHDDASSAFWLPRLRRRGG